MNSTKIEKQAILALENYLESSDIIDPKIPSNDKEMSWDGHLYLYNKDDFAKNNYRCRIPVQVKGKEVKSYSENFRYPIKTSDLNAYLTEGTLYFVTQLTSNGKKIFFTALYPLTIKNLLVEHPNQKTINVKMCELTMSLNEFEQFLIRFNCDCKKQVSAVIGDAQPFKMEDLQEQKIHKLCFTVPQQNDPLKLFSYLSTHPTFIYGEIQEGVEWPIGDLPVTMNFSKDVMWPVTIDARVYFDRFHIEIKGDNMVVVIGGCMKLSYDIKKKQYNEIVQFNQHASTLKSSIREAEFVLDLAEKKQVKVGNLIVDVVPNSKEMIDYYSEMLPNWNNMSKALEKIGYTGDLDISDIHESDARTISILIDSTLREKYYDLKDIQSGLVCIELLGYNFLVSVVRQEDNTCIISNAFDGSCLLLCRPSDDVYVPATIYSYLSSFRCWDSCDNIDFEGMVAAYDKINNGSRIIYEMANVDVLEMIKSADNLDDNNSRKKELLDAALNLSLWLEGNDKEIGFQYVYKLNQIQIRKRIACMTDDDIRLLNNVLVDSSVQSFVKAGAALLLDNESLFEILYTQFPDAEKDSFDKLPINKWRTSSMKLNQ